MSSKQTDEELVAVCCEYPKNGTEVFGEEPKPPVIYVCKRNPTGSDLTLLGLRGMYNPELQYYVCKVEKDMSDEDIIQYAKDVSLEEPYFIRL